MSSTFTPAGDGWVEVDETGYVIATGMPRAYFEDAGAGKFFVRPRTPETSLPARPGYYVAERPAYGDTVVVELLGSPAGQWVDAGDRNYLDEDTVRALGPLRPLALVSDILNEAAAIEISDRDPRPIPDQFRVGLAQIAAKYRVPR